MANNDGLLTTEEKNRISELIDSINNNGLTNDTIKVEAEVTANTESLDDKIISLNKAADEVFDKFDRGGRNVNPLDIFNMFGVNVDSVDNTNAEINQQNWNKIYDELGLLAKIVNKDPKLIGNLFNLANNGESLRIIIGDESTKNFYRELYKNSIIAEKGKLPSKEEIEKALGKGQMGGGSVEGQMMIGVGMTHGKNLDSGYFMHEYAHQIFDRYINKLLQDEYKLTKSGPVTKLKTMNDYIEAIDRKISANKYDTETKEFAIKMSTLLKNMASSMPKINTGDKEDDEYWQKPTEIFARTFANYASIFSSNQLSNILVPSEHGQYTPKITKTIYNNFQDLFTLDTNGNILNQNKELRQLMFIKNANDSHTIVEAMRNILLSNANQNNQNQSVSQINGIIQKLKAIGMLDNLNISPIDFNRLTLAFTAGGIGDNEMDVLLSKIDKNYKYKSEAGYNLKHISNKIKQDKFTELDIENLADYVKNFHENVKKFGYESLSTESINDVISAIQIINKSSLSNDYDFNSLRTSLKSELNKRPTNINNSKEVGNCANFEECIKSMCDTFKSNFANVIEQTANIFKHAFERAISTYQNLNLGKDGSTSVKSSINSVKDVVSESLTSKDRHSVYSLKSKIDKILAESSEDQIEINNILDQYDKIKTVVSKSRHAHEIENNINFLKEYAKSLDSDNVIQSIISESIGGESVIKKDSNIELNIARKMIDLRKRPNSLEFSNPYVQWYFSDKNDMLSDENKLSELMDLKQYEKKSDKFEGSALEIERRLRNNIKLERMTNPDYENALLSVESMYNELIENRSKTHKPIHQEQIDNIFKYIDELKEKGYYEENLFKDIITKLRGITTKENIDEGIKQSNILKENQTDINKHNTEQIKTQDDEFIRKLEILLQSGKNLRSSNTIEGANKEIMTKEGYDYLSNIVKYLHDYEDLIPQEQYSEYLKETSYVEHLLRKAEKKFYPDKETSSPVNEQTPNVPNGFNYDEWMNTTRELLKQVSDDDLKIELQQKAKDIRNNVQIDNPLKEDIDKANEFIEQLKQAVANAKPISETVKDTVKETVNSADTVKKTEEIINETVNNTKKTIESGTVDSGKGGNKTPKEQKPPSGYTGEYFIYEKFKNTGRDKEYGVGSDEFNIKGKTQDKKDIIANISPEDTKAIINNNNPDKEWKIDLGDKKEPDSLATLKAIMELNETATHILKHMSDFYKFQFNNPTNPEVTPMEWQNINYKFRSERIHDKLFGTAQNQNLGYFSQQYRIGNELRNYSDFLAGGSRADSIITELQGLFDANQEKIAEANQTGTNPMETLKLLEKQAELKAQLVFRTKELIKAERDAFREQEKQRRKTEKTQKQELTKTGRLQKIERALDVFNNKSVLDANGNVVKNIEFSDYQKAQQLRAKIWSAKDSLKDMTDEEFEKTIADINNAFFEYKEATKAFRINEKNKAKELNKTTKDIENQLKDNKKSLSGILGENSTYKDVFGKYGISGLSDREGKFKLTGEEYNVIHNINKDIESVEKELANAPENDADTKNKLKERLEGLNKSLDDYIQNTVAKRAESVASLEDKYKEKVIPTLEHINMMYGHIFDTKADIDYGKLQSGDFKDKFKEWTKFIDFKKISANLFNVNNLKKYSSQFIGYVKQMVGTTVKMFTSAFNKIYGIVSKVIKSVVIGITGAVATVTAAITGFVASFTAMGKSVINATDIYRKQTISLVGVYKTPSKSREMINSVYDITRAMPVNYTQAVQTLSEMSAIPALQNILRSPDSNKSSQLLTKMFKVITAMTTMRPDQNSSGAIFSLRNAFAGDLRSLQRRFDLPVSNIMNSRGTMGLAAVKTDPMAMLDSLENYFDTFLDVETLNKVSDTISVIMEKTKGAFDLFKANIGNSGFYDLVAQDLRKIRDFVINFVTSEDGKSFAKRISDIFSNVYDSVKSMVVKTRKILTQIFNTDELSFGNTFVNILEYFAKIVKYFDEFYNVKTIVDYVNELFKTIDSYKPLVYEFLDKTISNLKEIGSSVLNVSKYVVSTAIDIVNTLKATGLSDKGILFLWLFGPGNVVSLITAGLGALASGIMVAVTAAGLFATTIGSIGVTATLVVGAVGALVGIIGVLGVEMATAGENFAENFKTFFVDVIIGGIDKIIYEINNLPTSVKIGMGGLLGVMPGMQGAAAVFAGDQITGASEKYLKLKYGDDIAGGIDKKISGGAKRMSDNGSALGSIMYYGGSALSGLVSMVKESFTGDSFIMDFAKNGLDAIKTRLGGIATKYTGWKPDDSKTVFENIENILESILNKINSIELNNYQPPYEAKNYEKQIARLTIDLQQLYSQRSGIWNSKSRSDTSKKMFTTSYGNFGAEGIQELQTKRLETIESIYQTLAQASNINPEIDPNKWEKLMINIKKLGDEVDKINNYIKDTAIKSIDMIFDSLATKEFKYIQNDVSTYVKAKRQSMDAELMAEITDSLRLQYSVYFATTDEFDKFMDKATEKYRDDFNKLSFDMGFDYIDYTKFEIPLSETGQNIAKELGRRYLAERAYYDNVLTQRNIIEATNKNINKLSLNNLKQNWTSYMNSPYKKVRETAGNVYLDRVKEGIEYEDVGSMIRKVRDIAIESFTDMKTSIINAVQEIVKSTQQTIKNGLDKIIMEGGSFKNSFKELGDNIKKNYWGIYTNKAANDITKFIYGEPERVEKIDPVVEVNNSIIEGNKNITNKLDEFMTQVKNDASTQLSDSNTRQDALIDMFREVKHGNSIAVTSSKDVEIQQEVTSNPEKYYTTNSVLNPDTLADVSMTIATNWEHAGQCAAGVRAAFDAIVDDKAYKLYTQNGKLLDEQYLASYGNFGGKRAFGFSSSVIDAKDYYDAIKNNPNFETFDTTGKTIEDILSILKRGDILTWKGDVVENGVRSVKQHIGIYQGNGILTSDHVEDLRRKDWIGQRYSKGYGLPQISRLKTELTELGDALSDIKYNYYQISKPIRISEMNDGYNNRFNSMSYNNGIPVFINYNYSKDIEQFQQENPEKIYKSEHDNSKGVSLYTKFKDFIADFGMYFDNMERMLSKAYRQYQIDSIGKISDYDMAKIKSIGYSEFHKDIKFGHELAGPVPLFKAEYRKQTENITRTGLESDTNSNKKEEVSYLKEIYTVLYSLVQRGIESNVSVYAPVVNNVISGISTVESLSDRIGGINMAGFLGDSNNVSSVAKGISGNKYVQLAAKTLPGVGNFVNMLSGEKTLTEYGNDVKNVVQKKETPLKGIWGQLFGTVENVESTFGGASVGSFLGNMMSGKGIVDSLAKTGIAAISTKTLSGTKLLESLKGANAFTKVATGLTSTLFGKSAGATVAKTLTGGNILGMSLGTALPVVGAVAYGIRKLTKTKDKTAEGRARYSDFQSLKQGLLDRRYEFESTYALASDKTRGMLSSYNFANIGFNVEHKGGTKRHLKGTARDVAHTDATAFINSLTGYHSLLMEASKEQAQGKVKLDLLQSTDNMEYLKQSNKLVSKQATANDKEMKKYQDAMKKYAGKDANFKQTLFDGKEYTLAELEEKVEEFIKTFGDLSEQAYQLSEEMRKEQLNTEYAKLDYKLALDNGNDPLLQYKNEIEKLNLEWASVNNGKGYTYGTREWYEFQTKMLQATQNLENATEDMEKSTKELEKSIGSDWVKTLSGIRKQEGTYLYTQVRDIAELYSFKSNYETVLSKGEDAWGAKLTKETRKTMEKQLEDVNDQIDHLTAQYTFRNRMTSIKQNISDSMIGNYTAGMFGAGTKGTMENILDYAESLFEVNKYSGDFLKTGAFNGYDDFMSQIISPLVENINTELTNMVDVYNQLYNSGYYSRSAGESKFLKPMNNYLNQLDTYQTAYISALQNGNQNTINKALKNLENFLSSNSTYFKQLGTSFAEAKKLLNQNNARESVLSSISGYDDYEIANTALKNMRSALGNINYEGFNQMLGAKTGMTSFTNSNMKNWFGVSGEDPYTVYYEWQKKNILQRIENEQEGSDEWYQAELDLWNLMMENAKYLKEKAEKTSQTIEDMLGRIEETAKTRVAEEAKTTKGDIIFFDVGASRDSAKWIDSMIKAIKTNDPKAQELVNEFKKKKIGA